MEVTELGQLVLDVRDLGRSVRLYHDVLGWRPILGAVQPAQHELLLIEVGPGAAAVPPGRRGGLHHFGLKVGDSDDELREALATLKKNDAAGLGTGDPPSRTASTSPTPTATRSSCTSPCPVWTGRATRT